jgi:hypothetical protein
MRGGEAERSVCRDDDGLARARIRLLHPSLEHVIQSVPVHIGEAEDLPGLAVRARSCAHRYHGHRKERQQGETDQDVSSLQGTLLPGEQCES